MVFSSFTFLFLFLPIALGLYFVLPSIRLKNIALTVLSLVFYAWGEPIWVVLLLFSAAVDYCNGRVIGRYRGQAPAKVCMVLSVVINLGLLAGFKYLNFFIGNINSLFGLAIPTSSLTLPIGISFYTFQTMSYSIDVYRGNVPVQKSFGKFLLFVSLFPQLIAGPIVRYSEVEPQLGERRTTPRGFVLGATRFMCGLAKKVLVANYAGAAAVSLLDGGITGGSTLGSWLGILLYAFQIYFDFSGYSDMAIGLGRIFGFKYAENFDYPYIAKSITEFWRRWHMTLGSFFRDYVYIPLGGNRKGLPRQLLNMLIVWALTGFWHGASWNFVLWGLWFFVFLAVEKLIGLERLERIPSPIRLVGTLFLVLVGWVFFYYTDLGDGIGCLQRMFGVGVPLINDEAKLALVQNIPLLMICFIGSTPLVGYLGKVLVGMSDRGMVHPSLVAIPAVLYNAAMLLLCTVSLAGSSYNPFIYFRF